jgi:hypothetical protein
VRFLRVLIPFVLCLELVSAQVTVPLQGVPYTFTGHPRWLLDGPDGPITARSKDPDGMGPLVAPKAVAGNLAWKVLVDAAHTILATGYDHIGWSYAGDTAQLFATICFADNSQTSYCNAAQDMIDHMEAYVPFGVCVESQPKCGVGIGDYGITSYGGYWITGWTAAFTLMREMLTQTERQTFVAKLLNDVSAYGGTNGSASTSCTNTTAPANASVTSASGTTVTLDSPVFGTVVQVGDRLWTNASQSNIPKVVSIIDSTHAVVDLPNSGLSGVLYRWPAVFNSATDCGWIWAAKHDLSIPYVLTNTGGVQGAPTLYPPSGGSQSDLIYGVSNLMYIDLWGALQAFDVAFEDDVNAPVRSIAEFSAAYNFWHESTYAFAKTQWTGLTASGISYGYGRAALEVPGIAFMIQNQTVSPAPLNLMAGVWAKNILPESYMNTFPGEPESAVQWGQLYASNIAFDINTSQWLPVLIRAFNGTPEAAFANYWMRNMLPAASVRFGTTPKPLFWTESNLNRQLPANAPNSTTFLLQSWLYLFTDPADAATDLSTAPLQKGFNVTDTLQRPLANMISRTSFTDPNATMVRLDANYLVTNSDVDHWWEGSGRPGSYKILKNNYGLAEDWPGAYPDGLFIGGYTSGFDGSGDHSNYIQLGDDSTLAGYTDGHGGSGSHVFMPQVNDSNNALAYAMADLTNGYTNNPTRVLRHLLHLKKPGTQDFIFVYDDVSTKQGIKKTTFLHYANNGVAPRGNTTYTAGTIISNYPGTGHADATQLLTQVFSPAGPGKIVVSQDGAAYPGAGGNSYRFSICASRDSVVCDTSNTGAEFLVVHMPAVGANNSFPVVTDISGPDFAGVQVGGASPKLALFPRNGLQYPSAAFTATHTGTAQIAVAGLRKGVYTVTRDGLAAATINVGDDGLLYYEGLSGTYSISTRAAVGIRIQAATVQGGSLK